MRFDYQAEKLSQARSSLMAPLTLGEAHAFYSAFDFCGRAFHDFDLSKLDDSARGWADTILRFMDTSGLQDPAGRGLWLVRAEAMTVDERREFSNAVDELASWFDREFWRSADRG